MKGCKSFIFLLMLVVFSFVGSNQVNAQDDIDLDKYESSLLLTYPSTSVDSVTSTSTHAVSEWFVVDKYDASASPIYYTKKYTSVSGKPYVTTVLEMSNDQLNVVATDTLGGVKDSLETLYSGTLSISGNKYLYWRIKHIGESKSTTLKNRADTKAYMNLLFIKPE